MLTVKYENSANSKDMRMIEAFRNSINLYKDNTIDKLWEDVKECQFEDHNIGRGGNHIWIARKSDNERIGIIE